MLSMLKLLMIPSLLITSIWANKVEDQILKFEKNRISKNKRIKLKEIKLFLKKDLNQNGWVGYVFDLSIVIKGKDKKDIKVKDTIFSDGKMISPELINIKTRQSFKKMMYPKLSSKYYDKKYLIAGNENAKHTLVLFSDPLCPICTEVVPEIIKDVQNNPNILALYYIHMPLDMHPTAKLLVKASILAHQQGIKNIDYKVYTANFEKDFDAYKEKDKKKVLKIFNKRFKTKITMKQINSKKLNNKIKYDLNLAENALVNGTPTLFFDGKIDTMRNKYEKYIK